MKETIFYELMDKLEDVYQNLPKDLQGYYPTVDEIKRSVMEIGIEKLSPVLIFTASNPYKDNEEIRKRVEYKEAVLYAKKLLTLIPIEE